MLFNFESKKQAGCISVGFFVCAEWGWSGKHVNL